MIERLANDRIFYEKLCAARIALFNAGQDGTAWVKQHFNLSILDMQSYGSKYGLEDFLHTDIAKITCVADYQEYKRKQYKKLIKTNDLLAIANNINAEIF